MDWFLETEIRVVSIIVVAIVLLIICKLAFPSLMKRLISHRMSGEDETETQKRTDTLPSIVIKIAGIVILILAVLTILPEFGVNITTLIAGIGVGGLAIAFAAQNLVRDFIPISEDVISVASIPKYISAIPPQASAKTREISKSTERK